MKDGFTAVVVGKKSAGVFIEAAATLKEQRDTHTLNLAKKKMFSSPIHCALGLFDALTSTCYLMHQLVIPVGWFPLIPTLY